MLDDLFHKVKKMPGCVTFPPAADERLKSTNAFLLSRSLAPLTDDFQQFLKLSDGFSFDGIEFYGTEPHQRPGRQYIFPDLMSITQPYCRYEFFRNKAIVGRLSESIMIYNGNENIFAIIDRVNLQSRIELPGFEDIFRFMLRTSRVE